MTDTTPTLRDRIADALAAADGWEWGPDHDSLTSSVIGRYLRRADAVLAVLPAPVDRAAILRERAEFFEGCIRNAADPEADPRYWSAIHDVAMGLRRMADEAPQPTDGEAYPARHQWRTETHDPLANEWNQGTPYTERADAVARHQFREERFPTWKDGAPVKRRLVRVTTTYTVEQPAPAVTEEATPEVGKSKQAEVIRLAADADPYAGGVCTYGEDRAPGAGCIKPAGHDGPHLVTPGDADPDDDTP